MPHPVIQDKISIELDAYKNAIGLFGNVLAKRHRKIKSPGNILYSKFFAIKLFFILISKF